MHRRFGVEQQLIKAEKPVRLKKGRLPTTVGARNLS